MTIIELVNELTEILRVGEGDREVRIDRDFYRWEPLASVICLDNQDFISLLPPLVSRVWRLIEPD